MSTITTRSGKGSPLTNNEVDNNFTNLNTDKAELSGATFTGEIIANAGIDVTGSIVASGDLQLGNDSVASNINAVGDVFVVNVDSNNNTGGTPNIQFKTSGNEKLRVNPTGIDVTGTATMGGLTVDVGGITQLGNIARIGDNSAVADLTLNSSDSSVGTINFADASDSNVGRIQYNHVDNTMILRAADATRVLVSSTGIDVTGRAVVDGLSSSASIVGTSNSNSLGGTTFTSAISTVGLSSTAAISSTSNSNSLGGTNFTSNIDVTGTATMDGLTVDGNIQFTDSGSSNRNVLYLDDSDNVVLATGTTAGARGIDLYTNNSKSLSVAEGGDISFYEDTGTTPKFFWDASAESLGIGGSPSEQLEVSKWIKTGSGAFNNGGLIFPYLNGSTSSRSYAFTNDKNTYGDFALIVSDTASSDPKVGSTVLTVKDKKVGIGTSSPEKPLHVNSGTGNIGVRVESSDATSSIEFMDSGTTSTSLSPRIGGISDDFFVQTSGSERMRVDSSGVTTFKYNTKVYTAGYPETRLGITDSNYFNFTFDNPSDALSIGKNGSTKMTLTAAGSVGIGTSSPTRPLTVNGNNGTGMIINDAANDKALRFRASGDAFFIEATNNAESAYANISLEGNVGIGTSLPSQKLDVSGVVRIASGSSGGYIGSGSALLISGTATDFAIRSDNALTFGSGGPYERMRIDSSGNLLLNRSATFTTAKMEIQSDAGDASTLALNSIDTDGSILEFYNAGTTVGSIGSIFSDLYIAEGNSGFRFDGENNAVYPCSTTASTNGTLNLGASGARFKDLHLSGGVYLGGTGDANKLDDYEEGTWTPVNTGTATTSTATGLYTKVGNLVTVQFALTFTSSGTVLNISGLPFTSVNSGAIAVGSIRENVTTGLLWQGAVNANATTVKVRRYDNNSAVSSGDEFVGTITYTAA